MLQPLKNYRHFQKLIHDKYTFLVYKYNPNHCTLSEKTRPRVVNFLNTHPSIQGYLIDVIEQPVLKKQVAEFLDVPHESPQVLCFKGGVLMDTTSHMKIKEERLKKVFS